MNKLIPRGFSMLKIKNVVIGSTLALAGSIGIFSLLSFILLKTGLLSCQIAGTITAIGAGAALFTAAILTARWAGEKGLLHGSAVSVIYCTVYVILTFLLCKEFSLVLLLTRIVIFVLCGASGGVIGVGGKKSVRF